MLNDLKLALRTLHRRPGFSSAVVVTLALGIGGSVAILGVIDGVLLRPLPFADADRLVEVWETVEREQIEEREFSYPDFLDLREQSTSLTALAAVSGGFSTLTRPESDALGSQRVPIALVSPGYFDLLGVAPALGAPLSDGAPDQVVLAHGLWQRQFGADPSILGRRLLLDGEPVTVAGVMPARFTGVFGAPELWQSIEAAPPGLLAERSSRWHSVIGRLAPGATIETARREVATIFSRLEAEHSSNNLYNASLAPLRERILGSFRRPLLLLFGAVALVLLVATVNVANLMIVRATTQRRQTALLAAVGASPRQLVRRVLVESLVLGLLAGAAAVVLAGWVLPILVARSPADLPAFVSIGLSSRVLAAALGLSVVCALGLGLGAWLTTDRHALAELVQGGRGTAAQRRRARSGLLVFELALSLVVAVSAGLLLRSWQQIRSIEPGFAMADRAILRVDHPGFEGEDAPQRAAILRAAIAQQLGSLPGIESAALASDLPLSGGASATVLSPEGRPLDDELPWGGATRVYRHMIGASFLTVLDIPLLAGRSFQLADFEGSPTTAMVSRTLAERLWPTGEAVGRRFKLGRPAAPVATDADAAEPSWITVVGVVPDVRFRDLVQGPQALPPDPDVYFPLGDSGPLTLSAVAHTALDPSVVARMLEERLAAVDPLLVVYAPETFAERIAVQTSRLRFTTLLMTLFAFLAVGLAAVGVHGVMAYLVGERTAEIGIRMAIGAERGQVVREVLAQGMRLVAIGLALGTLVSLAVTRTLETQLVGTSARDPLVLIAAAILLVGVAITACASPARRASRVDPLVALRASE